MTATHKFPMPTVSFDLTTSEMRQGQKLRIGLVSVDERCFIRPMWAKVAECFPKQVHFVYEIPFGNPHFSLGSLAALAAIVYGWKLPALLALETATRILRCVSLRKGRWLRQFAEKVNCEYHFEAKFSNAALKRFLDARKPDVVLCQVPNLISKEVLDVPTYGCWNKHFGKLPEERGSAPFLYSLSSGRTTLHYSIYVMGDKYDCGLLVRSGEIQFQRSKSMFANLKVLNNAAVEALIDGLRETEREGSVCGVLTGDEFPTYRLPRPLQALAMAKRIACEGRAGVGSGMWRLLGLV